MRSALIVSAVLLLVVPSIAVADEDVDRSKKAWLGVSVQDMTSKLAKSMNVKTEEGALVSEVLENGPAETSGVEEKDIIVEFNGRKIYDADDLIKAVQRLEPGTKADLVVIRKTEQKKISVTLGTVPRRLRSRTFGIAPPMPRIHVFRSGYTLGVELMQLNDQLAEYFQVPAGEGVLVMKVEKKSAAEKGGLKAGDVILRIGSRAIDDVRDVRRTLGRYKEGEKAEIEVMRKGAKQTLTVVMEEGEGYSEHEGRLFDLEFERQWNDLKFDLKVHPRIEIQRILPERIEIPEVPRIHRRVVRTL